MRRARFWNAAALAAAVVLLSRPIAAPADDPTFTFAPPEKVTKPQWKATAQAGLNVSTGNAQALSLSASGSVSRRSGDDRLSLDAFGAFARSRIDVASDVNGTPGIGPDEIQRVVQTTSKAWSLKARYDRFVGERDSFYGATLASGDEPAGKDLLAGGQVGYSREVMKRGPSTITLELGYDLSYQEYVAASPVLIQSARLYAGYELTPAPAVGAKVSAEALTNLNHEQAPNRSVEMFHDNRLVGRAELNVKINDHGTLGARLRVRYDTAPAPRPPPPGLSWEAGYVPLAERLDTISEVVFGYSFF